MYDIEHFALSDMIRCNAHLRKIGQNAASMEEVAQRAVRYLNDNTLNLKTFEKQCALVRFYKTHAFSRLPPELQSLAAASLGPQVPSPQLRCLTLLATAGAQPNWNDRRKSLHHQVIPLTDRTMIARAPMIAGLIKGFGLDVETVLQPQAITFTDESETHQFDVFYIPQALDSPAVPAQNDFVKPHGIASILGFGGMLHTGDIFALILFTRVHIPPDTAEMFKTIALATKLALLPFSESVFTSDLSPRS